MSTSDRSPLVPPAFAALLGSAARSTGREGRPSSSASLAALPRFGAKLCRGNHATATIVDARYAFSGGRHRPPSPAQASRPQWIAVRQRFEQFAQNLMLTSVQVADGVTKCQGVVRRLNRRYYG